MGQVDQGSQRQALNTMSSHSALSSTLTHSLSKFARELRFEDLPHQAVERAQTAIVDCLGCMVAGTQTQPGQIALKWAVQESGGPLSTVVGMGLKTSPSMAAFVNGVTAHALDYDDVSPPMIGHPSVPLVPALLAAAERVGASGSELLTAYIVGFDVEARLGRLMNPEHYAHGWHATSTLGALAAAVGVATLMKLPDSSLRNALGIAASGAGGLRKNFGSMSKALHAGQAAQRGISAAMLAAIGFDADPEILEGPHGFLDTFRGSIPCAKSSESALFTVDQTLEILSSGVGIKQYACCGCSHTSIDALLTLVKAHAVKPVDIERVECRVNSLVPGVLIHEHATTGFQGKFSMHYSVAVALLDGEAGPRQFEDERARQDDVQALQRRVSMTVDPSIPIQHGVFPAKVSLHLKGGAVLYAEAQKAQGMHPDLPLSQGQVDLKFLSCASYSLSESDAKVALDLLHQLPRLNNLQPLMSLLLGR